MILALDAVHNVQCLVARAAAGTVGDRAEIRSGHEQRGQMAFEQRAVTLVRLGRKKLEGDGGFAGGDFGGQNVADEFHGGKIMPEKIN